MSPEMKIQTCKDKASTEKIFCFSSSGMHGLPYTPNKLLSSKTYVYVNAHFSTIVIRDVKIFPSSLIFLWGSIFYTIRSGVHFSTVLYLRNLTRITINIKYFLFLQCFSMFQEAIVYENVKIFINDALKFHKQKLQF